VTRVCYHPRVWILFVAIGTALLCVLAYGWGLAKGSELTRAAQARLHDALRASSSSVVEAHERERAAWRAAELATQSWLRTKTGTREAQRSARTLRDEAEDAAEAAHDATRHALETLRAALTDSQEGDALDQARRRTERRTEAAAQRRSQRALRDSVEDDAQSHLSS
jgi:hypothetical protein